MFPPKGSSSNEAERRFEQGRVLDNLEVRFGTRLVIIDELGIHYEAKPKQEPESDNNKSRVSVSSPPVKAMK